MSNNELSDDVRKMSLFALTWPLLIELFLQILMGSMDTFMLAHVSDEAVAAVGVANQLISVSIILFGFIGTGTAVIIAQYLGARKYQEASKVVAVSITVNLLFGLLISVLVVLFRGKFLQLMNVGPQLASYADTYMMIVGGSLFVQSVLLTISAVVRSHGFTRDAMLVSLGMNIIHVFGNYLFIYGALGVPQLGVTGVAVSTAISRILAVVVGVFLMYRRVKYPIQRADYIKLDMSYVRKVLKIGIPSAGEQLSWQGSQVVITAFITMLGTAALATRVYTQNVMFFIMLFGLALGQGTQIMVGHLIGAGDKEAAYHQLLKSLKWSLLITLAAVLTVAAFRESIIGIFTDDVSIIGMGATLLAFCIILEPGRTFNLVVINSLRAAGDVEFPVIMGILSMWGISVPVSFLLGIHYGLGLLGFWIAFAIDEWFRGILMYWRWKSRAWEKKSLVFRETEGTSLNL